MRITYTTITTSLPVSCCALLTGMLPAVVRAGDKSKALSSLGTTGDVMGGGIVMQSVTALIIVLISVVALAWIMRRFGRLQSSAKGALQLIDGMALSARERIVLVQVGETQVLLGVAPGRVEAVHVLDIPVVAGNRDDVTGNFAARLRDAVGRGQS